MRITVTFRGQETDVIVDRYDDDISTNSCEIEWHFDGVNPEEHADLHVTDEEEEGIISSIHVAAADGMFEFED